jgi:hypothetical protein
MSGMCQTHCLIGDQAFVPAEEDARDHGVSIDRHRYGSTEDGVAEPGASPDSRTALPPSAWIRFRLATAAALVEVEPEEIAVEPRTKIEREVPSFW